MIDGQFAGWLTGLTIPGRWLSLPAAATIREPAADARRATASNTCEKAWPGCAAAPSDIEITAHLLATAQLMPARIWESEPDPALLNTLPAKILASYAMP